MAKPMFQHRHYCAIAQVVASMPHPEAIRASELIEAFCNVLSMDNAGFDVARFKAACAGKPSNGRDKRGMKTKKELPAPFVWLDK